MSIEALAWSFKQDVFPSSHKFVLVAFANHANDEGKTYPGVTTIAKLTCQDERTVYAAIEKLLKDGFLTDTGERRGVTGRAIVYQLPEESIPTRLGVLKSSNTRKNTRTNTYINTPILVNDHIEGTGNRNQEEEPLPIATELMQHWNSFKTLPAIVSMSASRTASLRRRLRDQCFNEYWRESISKMAVSSFLTGKTTGERKWKATIDWFLKPDSVAKVMEGNYDDTAAGPKDFSDWTKDKDGNQDPWAPGGKFYEEAKAEKERPQPEFAMKESR